MKNFATFFLLVIGFVLFNQLSASAQKTLPLPGFTTYTVSAGQSKVETDNVSVTLKPGVHIKLGASFHAYIMDAVVPSKPTGLTATAVSTSQINLTWADNAENETGFQVWTSQNSGSGFTLLHTTGANVTSYINNGLSPSTTRYYKVRAINSTSQSDYSNEAHATTSSVLGGDCVDWNKPSTIKWIGINNIQDNTSGGTKEHPWSLRYGMEGGGAATLHDGNVVYIKGDEGDYIIGDKELGIIITKSATGTDIAQDLANENIQNIMNKCIHYMSAPGQRAIIRRAGLSPENVNSGKAAVEIGKILPWGAVEGGKGVLVWNIEITSDNWSRDRRNKDNDGGDAPVGFLCNAPSSGLINSIIDNNGTNAGPNKKADGYIYYGNLASHSGYLDDRFDAKTGKTYTENHGPNFYLQNYEDNKKATIIHNIAQFSGSENFQAYYENKEDGQSLVANMNWIENIAFDASGVFRKESISNPHVRGNRNFLMGGYNHKINNSLVGNLSYSSSNNNNSYDQIGYIPGATPYPSAFLHVTENLEAVNNYFHGWSIESDEVRSALFFRVYGKNNVFMNNTIINPKNGVLNFSIRQADDSPASKQNFDFNTYHCVQPENKKFQFYGIRSNGTQDAHNKSFIEWKNDTGRDLHSTVANLPTTNRIFYRTNMFRGYGTSGLQGYIVIYNWENKNTVTIDPLQSNMLCSGDAYKIVDSQNFKNSLVSGAYSGGDISINMNQTTVTPTKGAVSGLGTPNHTDKKFICLMVYKTDMDYKGAGNGRVSGKSSINIYPNPTSGVVTINFADNKVNTDAIRIVDKLNQNIKYSVLQKDKTKMAIRIHGGNEEIYFMKINTNKGVLTEKIIIKK